MTNINDDKIDLRRFFAAVKKWKWIYVITFVVFMTGSIYFAFTREPKYDVWAITVVESEQSGGGSLGAGMNQLMNMFSIGGFGSTSSDNEKVVMQSNTVLREVVKTMKLNCEYFRNDGFMRKKTLYGNSPLLLTVNDENYFDTVVKSTQFKISLKENGKADIKVVRGMFNTLYEVSDADLPASVDLDHVRFTLMPTDYYDSSKPMKMNIMISGYTTATDKLSEKVSVSDFDKKSDALVLNYKDTDLQRGKDVLNTLISKYYELRLAGKTDKMERGLKFIDDQINEIYSTLNSSEVELELFKRENNITEVSEDVKVLLEAASKLNEDILEVRAQTMMCDLVLKFLTSEESKYSLLPTVEFSSVSGTSGSKTSALNTTVAQYNEMIMQRMRLLRSAKPDNVALTEVTKNIDALRDAVIESVTQQRANIEAGMSVLQTKYDEFEARINSAPSVERQYVDIERRVKLNNQVYLLLMGKKIDYQMREVSNVVPMTIIDKAYSIDNESSRKSSMVFPVIGLIFSLFFPTAFVVYMMYRHKEINKEYDMPASVAKNGFAVYDDPLLLRSMLLGNEKSKLIPVMYNADNSDERVLVDAVADLCDNMSSAGKKVVVLDLGNVSNCDAAGRDLANIKPGKLGDTDCVGYAGRPSDVLLSGDAGRFISCADGYGNVVMLMNYSTDSISALSHFMGDEKSDVMYMVNGGVTKRAEVDAVVKSCQDCNMLFYIY